MSFKVSPKLFAIACFALVAQVVRAESDTRVFFTMENFSHSDAFPLKSYINYLVGPDSKGGTHVLTRNYVASGMSFGDFEISIFHRNDYHLDFSVDAGDFSYRNKNGIYIDRGKIHNVDVSANQYQISGLKLAHAWELYSDWTLRLAGSVFGATESRYGYLGKNRNGEGGVVYLEDVVVGGQTLKVLKGDLYTDYYFSKDPFFESEMDASVGKGFNIDMGVDWQINPSWSVSLDIQDLLGKIYWSDMPHTTAEATSTIAEFEDDGFRLAIPNFSGRERRSDFAQPFRQRQRLNINYQYKQYVFGFEHDRIKIVNFNRLSAAYLWGDDWSLKLAYDVSTTAKSLEWHFPFGEFSLMMDTFDVETAHNFGFNFGVHYTF